MPKAIAPKAPWVEVCESPQTIVIPGWVSPSCGPTTWTIPCSTSPSGCSRTPNSAAFLRSVSTCVRLTGSAIGLSTSSVGTLWSSVASVRSGRRTRRPASRSPSKACGRGHLVDEVEVDVEQVRLPLGAADDVLVPHLLRQGPSHCSPPRASTLPLACISTCETALSDVWTTLAESASSTKPPSCSRPWSPGPATLAGLVAATGLARPTAHRLAVALEHHRLVARDMQGRFVLGPRLAELSAAAGEDRLLAAAGPVLARLRDITGESAQLWRRQGDHRVCVAAAERPSGLRDTIPVGSQLTMRAGSAAQVLLAWEDPERMHRGLQNAAFSATALVGDPPARLGPVRRRARGRRRVGVGAGPLALGQDHRRGLGLRARSSGSPGSPVACTPPRCSPPPTGSRSRCAAPRSRVVSEQPQKSAPARGRAGSACGDAAAVAGRGLPDAHRPPGGTARRSGSGCGRWPARPRGAVPGEAEPPRDLAVRRGLAVADLPQRSHTRQLERRPRGASGRSNSLRSPAKYAASWLRRLASSGSSSSRSPRGRPSARSTLAGARSPTRRAASGISPRKSTAVSAPSCGDEPQLADRAVHGRPHVRSFSAIVSGRSVVEEVAQRCMSA